MYTTQTNKKPDDNERGNSRTTLTQRIREINRH